MSKDVIEKPGHILVYKIVEHYESIRRKQLIELARKYYREIFGKEVSQDTVLNWIRELKSNDKRCRHPLLTSKAGYYRIKRKASHEGMKGLVNTIDQYLRLESLSRENRILSAEVRIRHTEKLKDRVIKPLMHALESLNFEEVRKEVLLEDLANHLPAGIKNPISLMRRIERKKRELERRKRELLKRIGDAIPELSEGFVAEGIARLLFDLMLGARHEADPASYVKENLRKSVRAARIEDGVFMPYLVYRFDSKKFEKNKIKIKIKNKTENKNKKSRTEDEMREFINEKIESAFRHLRPEDFEELRKIAKVEEEIKKLKDEMLKVLTELDAYEILPGACKYIENVQ